MIHCYFCTGPCTRARLVSQFDQWRVPVWPFTSKTSSHAIFRRPREALISGGEKGRLLHISLLCVWVCSIELKVNSFSDKHTHRYSLSLSHVRVALWTVSFLAVLVEIENKTSSKHLELRCNGGNVMHYIKTFSLNFWRGMYLKKECNAVFRLLTS